MRQGFTSFPGHDGGCHSNIGDTAKATIEKEVKAINLMRKAMLSAAVAGTMLAGGAVGATVFSAAPSGAAGTTSTSPTQVAPPGGPDGPPPNGTFKPNEDKTHEGSESAQRETQETAGRFPTVR